MLACLVAAILGCGSNATARPVTPAQAALNITGTFTPFKNQYGDTLEALNLHISSTIPVPFKVQVHYMSGPDIALHSGNADQACGADYGCTVKPGQVALDDFYCDNTCRSGTYMFQALVCSYNSDQFLDACEDQTEEYIAWVGKLGQNLKGNPLAKPDKQHPAILNLVLEVTLNHP